MENIKPMMATMHTGWMRSNSVLPILLLYYMNAISFHPSLTHIVVSSNTNRHYLYSLFRTRGCKTKQNPPLVKCHWLISNNLPGDQTGKSWYHTVKNEKSLLTWDTKMTLSLYYPEIQNIIMQPSVVCSWPGFSTVEFRCFAWLWAQGFFPQRGIAVS